MIKATMNQKGNVLNPNQGSTKKVLCVCSAGLLRSPTAANVLHKNFGYNTRACGVDANFALIPISEALVLWADEIVFMEQEHWDKVSDHPAFIDKTVIILGIEDDYFYGQEIFKDIFERTYIRNDGWVVQGRKQ